MSDDARTGTAVPIVFGTTRTNGDVTHVAAPPSQASGPALALEAMTATIAEVRGLSTDLLVEAWFVETFHNLGLHGELFNRFRRAADDLKARLRAKE